MGTLPFTVRAGDLRPVYRQIIEQVKALLASGRLRVGDQLPTHRDLARELLVAPLTVKKAYDVLQAEGLIHMIQGKGTFVAGRSSGLRDAAQADLTERVNALVRQAYLLGLRVEDVQQLIARHWPKGSLP